MLPDLKTPMLRSILRLASSVLCLALIAGAASANVARSFATLGDTASGSSSGWA
jgi:hypothetical protein